MKWKSELMPTDFNFVYPSAAELYLESDLDIGVVEAEFGQREDWELIKSMLLGSDGIPPHSVPGQPIDWYSTKKGDEYWPTHLQLLSEKKGWDASTIQSIDVASSRIINHLFNPIERGNQTRHGLVIGHVQSGKTANYTALLSKAADAGYNFFIVLTGLYNDLRDQTQARLSKELIGSLQDPNGIHILESKYSVKWKEETMVGFDFHDLDHPYPPDPNVPTICVIKKNVSPLGSLPDSEDIGRGVIDWFRTFDQATLDSLNVLIIDDEADHASVNMMNREANDYRGERERLPSTINLLLRSLVDIIPRVAYVGYTATPFANVFIDPNEDDEEYGMTLYPRDFIVSLPRPPDHFGLEDIFPPGADGDWPHVTIVPEDDAHILREMTDREMGRIPTLNVPESMWDAIIDYLIICGIRRCRGQIEEHKTMMIHTRHTIENMTPLVRRIRAIIQHIQRHLTAGRTQEGRNWINRFQVRFADEFVQLGCVESWEEVLPQIQMQLARDCPVVLEINMDSEDVLDFDANAEDGLKAIAVGGNRLSRGLTLEGLCVSFFVRPTTTHDTLMQMSRWFGFRRGFSDLARVHVTAEIAERFSGMVEVERQLRDDIERYEEQTEITPLDFGVRVLQQHGMNPTRPLAMRNVRTLSAGTMAGGQKTPYTESFHFSNSDILRNNLSQLATLLSQLEQPENIGNNAKNLLWRNIEPIPVMNFLRSLQYPEQSPWPIDEIIAHIEGRIDVTEDELSAWNLALIGLERGVKKKPLSDYGIDYELVLPTRSRKTTGNGNGLGWVAGSTDTVVDLNRPLSEFNGPDGRFSYNRMWARRDPSTPLILAYIIDKDSTADGSRGRRATSARTDLFRDGEEPVHVLALTIVMPQAVLTQEERDSVQREYWIRTNSEPYPGL